MITVDDVFHKIAQDIRAYSGADQEAAVDEFIQGSQFDMHLAITANVEDTELNFLEKYGHGHTFYFRLPDYEYGRKLASDIYWVISGERPELSAYNGAQFQPEERLYLFVHIRDIVPLPPAAA